MRPFVELASVHGHGVSAADGFNDWDLSHFLRGEKIGAETPALRGAALLSEWEKLPDDPIIFCSPIESFPEILESAVEKRTVLNSPATAVRLCRDQRFLRTVHAEGILFPEISFEEGSTGPGWIIKGQNSCGGAGIRHDDGKLSPGEYRQKFIEGKSVGAIYFTSGGETQLCGVAEHINLGFKFAGCVFTAGAKDGANEAIGEFGKKLASATGLLGWWGADFVLADGSAYLLEVNPRFTAGMELMAKSFGTDIFDTQRRAFSGDLCHIKAKGSVGYLGRTVVYSRNTTVFREPEKWFLKGLRDLPFDGRTIAKDEPLVSIYSTGSSREDCMANMARRRAEFEEIVYGKGIY